MPRPQIGMVITEVETAIRQYQTQANTIHEAMQNIKGIIQALENGWWGQAEDQHQQLMGLWLTKQTEIRTDLDSVKTKVQNSLNRIKETDTLSAGTFSIF